MQSLWAHVSTAYFERLGRVPAVRLENVCSSFYLLPQSQTDRAIQRWIPSKFTFLFNAVFFLEQRSLLLSRRERLMIFQPIFARVPSIEHVVE